MGLVFSSRRAWIDPEHFDVIADEDGLRKLLPGEPVHLGDVVIYRTRNDEIVHIGIIVQTHVTIAEGQSPYTILSQWGAVGEFFHDFTDLPGPLKMGDPQPELWTDRRDT